MHSYTTDAIILKRFNLGEADRVLTLYTLVRGRVSAIVRGARRTNSRLGGHVELFAWSRLTLSEGKTFDLVTSAELKASHSQLASSVERVNAAHYVAEAVLKLTVDEQVIDRLFELLSTTFRQLASATSTAGILAGFQLKLLTILGHQPVLERCVHCNSNFQVQPAGSNLEPITHHSSLITKEVVGFDPLHGGLVCRNCLTSLQHPIIACDPEGQAALRVLLTEPMHEAHSNHGGFRTATRVIEQALLNQTERPLKSRAFVDFVPVIATHD